MRSRRVLYFVHGRGRGHATRTLSVVKRLRSDGSQVRVCAGPDAYPMLRDSLDARRVPSLPRNLGWRTLSTGLARLQADTRQARWADVVVSDGDLPGLIAARVAGRPVVAVGHGLLFSHGRRPPGIPRVPWWLEAARAWSSSLGADVHVAVNFVPVAPRTRDCVIARPTVELPHVQDGLLNSGEVIAYFRDEIPQDVVKTAASVGYPVRVFSNHPLAIEGVQVHPPNRSEFIDAITRAHAVIATAGSQLISETVALGVPMFALHAAGDHEQMLNVAMLKQAKLGDGGVMGQVGSSDLAEFLHRAKRRPASSWDAVDVAQAVATACEGLAGR